MGLLKHDRIASADVAALQDRGIDPNVSPVVLGCCAQNTCILWEIALSERRHHAAGARAGDTQANHIPDCEDSPYPSILHEILLAAWGLDHDIWAKASDLEASLWIQQLQPIKRGGCQEMHNGAVEKVPQADRSR